MVNDRYRVTFEPFDAKAYMNHAFRDCVPQKWKGGSKNFNVSMKVQGKGFNEDLKNEIGIAEPFVNSLNYLGKCALNRKRNLTKEISVKSFSAIVRPQSREAAFLD